MVPSNQALRCDIQHTRGVQFSNKEDIMSEKQQHNMAELRLKMINKYGVEEHHKHNKLHSPYRLHWRSHPTQKFDGIDATTDVNGSTGHIREFNLQKTRKRLAKGRFH